MKHLFVDAHTLGKMKLQTLPHGPEFNVQLRTSPKMPFLPVSLKTLNDSMDRGIELTTKADFEGALKKF